MTIRVARGDPEDARHLLEASHALMNALFPAEVNNYLSIEALQAPEIRFFHAETGGAVAGCGALALRDGYGEVKSMYVDETARGQGIGGAVLCRLEQEARSLSLPFMRLETGSLLRSAHRLYGRHGFVRCGPFGDYTDGPFNIFMEKRLD